MNKKNKNTQHIFMVYIVCFLSGVINGLFASGAGQILVFFLIYILKKEAHISRATSLCLITFVTIISLVGYFKYITLNLYNLCILAYISIVMGAIGSCVMHKINGEKLNLISGIVILLLSGYSLWFR